MQHCFVADFDASCVWQNNNVWIALTKWSLLGCQSVTVGDWTWNSPAKRPNRKRFKNSTNSRQQPLPFRILFLGSWSSSECWNMEKEILLIRNFVKFCSNFESKKPRFPRRIILKVAKLNYREYWEYSIRPCVKVKFYSLIGENVSLIKHGFFNLI